MKWLGVGVSAPVLAKVAKKKEGVLEAGDKFEIRELAFRDEEVWIESNDEPQTYFTNENGDDFLFDGGSHIKTLTTEREVRDFINSSDYYGQDVRVGTTVVIRKPLTFNSEIL